MDGCEAVSADRINDLHRQAEVWRDKTIADAGQACRCVIECGLLLMKAKKQCKHGDWLVWLESNCPRISERTAQNYMRVGSKYAKALADGSLDFQTVKELFIASGIMPEPESPQDQPSKEQLPVWRRLTEKIEGLIEELKPEDKERLRAWCQLVLQRLDVV